jgi:Domain of unknown function (DUF4268)
MVMNTSKATRGPFAVPDVAERGASVRGAIAILLGADIRPDDKRYLLDMALWRLTEFDKNRYKFATRYRTRAVVEGPTIAINHEHVAPRQWLLDQLIKDPERSDIVLHLAVACIVTIDEHSRLKSAPGFGWARYRHAGLEVLDTSEGMHPIDLDAAVDHQSTLLHRLDIEPTLPERAYMPVEDATPTTQVPLASAVSLPPERAIDPPRVGDAPPPVTRVGKSALYHEFWKRLIAELGSRQSWSLGSRQVPDRNWLVVGRPLPGSSLQFDFCKQGLRHQLNLRRPDDAEKAQLVAALHGMHAEMEAAFGAALSIESMPGTSECRIAAYRPGQRAFDIPEHQGPGGCLL